MREPEEIVDDIAKVIEKIVWENRGEKTMSCPDCNSELDYVGLIGSGGKIYHCDNCNVFWCDDELRSSAPTTKKEVS